MSGDVSGENSSWVNFGKSLTIMIMEAEGDKELVASVLPWKMEKLPCKI